MHNCSYHKPYTTKHIYWYFLFSRNDSYDVFNSIIRWHPASVENPACIRDPASIGDPTSIRTSNLNPRLVFETRLLFGTRLLLEVLRYTSES